MLHLTSGSVRHFAYAAQVRHDYRLLEVDDSLLAEIQQGMCVPSVLPAATFPVTLEMPSTSCHAVLCAYLHSQDAALNMQGQLVSLWC